MLDLSGNTYFGLNAVARHIWASVEAGATFKEIVELICTEFEVDADTVVADVGEFLHDTLQQGLLTQVDTP